MTATTPALELRDTRRVVSILEDGERDVLIDGVELIDEHGARVAVLEWHADRGEIIHLWVAERVRRQGLATRMYRNAQEQTNGFVKHSAFRTRDGQGWASSLDEPLPAWRLV